MVTFPLPSSVIAQISSGAGDQSVALLPDSSFKAVTQKSCVVSVSDPDAFSNLALTIPAFVTLKVLWYLTYWLVSLLVTSSPLLVTVATFSTLLSIRYKRTSKSVAPPL